MLRITLKAARVNAGLTQKELAKKLKVAQTTVNNWEKGDSEPSVSQMREISRLSGIPVNFIFVQKEFR